MSNPEVKQLLEQNLGRLRDALAEQGLDLEGFSVDVGGQSTHAEGREEFGRQNSSGTRVEGGEVPEAVPASSAVRMPDSGDVDFTAWMAAILEIPKTSPLDSLTSRIVWAVSGVIRTEADAVAARAVVALSDTSTMWALPWSSKWLDVWLNGIKSWGSG